MCLVDLWTDNLTVEAAASQVVMATTHEILVFNLFIREYHPHIDA